MEGIFMNDEYAIAPVSGRWLSIQNEDELPPERIDAQLLVLQTAFPTVVRNYDKHEFKALQSLWHEIFKNVPEELLKEAVKRFIISDRKGFFPSPGQIIGHIEEIVKEREDEEYMRAWLEHSGIYDHGSEKEGLQ